MVACAPTAPQERTAPGLAATVRGARTTADTQSTPTTQSSPPSSNPPRLFSFSKCKILKRIPRGARDAVAEQLAQTIDAILKSPEVHEKWAALFAFPECCLAQPSEGGKRCRNLTTAVVRQTQRFKEEGVAALEQDTATERGPRKRAPLSPDAAAAKRAAAKVDERDVKGAICLLCSTEQSRRPLLQRFSNSSPSTLPPQPTSVHQHPFPGNPY